MFKSLDPTYPLYPVLSFLGFVAALIPFPWHLQAWNAGTCAYMLWVSLACLVEFVNSLVWAGNVDDNIPVWCDIATKFLLGAGVGIVASALCINRRLYNIASIQTVSISHADKRRMVIIDLCIAIGIPVLVMILHYIVQPHRYNILEDIGCQPAVYNTLASYFLVFMWPVLLGLISFIYSALTLRAFWQRRVQFAQLISSNSSLNVSRYIRLMSLAVIDMTITIPLGAFSIYIASHGIQLAPWVSWEDVHFNFSRVDLVPSLVWRNDASFRTSVELTRWLFPVSAFLFFALFGFASEAQKQYKTVFHRCLRSVGLDPAASKPSSKPSKPSYLPTYNWTHQTDAKAQLEPYAVYSPTLPASGKASRFSLTSSDDATVRVDLDIEKSSGLGSPISTTCPTYSYPPSSSASHFSTTDMSPNPSVSRSVGHWPPTTQ